MMPPAAVATRMHVGLLLLSPVCSALASLLVSAHGTCNLGLLGPDRPGLRLLGLELVLESLHVLVIPQVLDALAVELQAGLFARAAHDPHALLRHSAPARAKAHGDGQLGRKGLELERLEHAPRRLTHELDSHLLGLHVEGKRKLVARLEWTQHKRRALALVRHRSIAAPQHDRVP